MPDQLNHGFNDSTADQQRFLSLFLMSEREFFRYVAVLVSDASDADDIVQQMSITLRERFDSDDPDWAC
jgi:DNA-directed RNA polymerase specialized sigma24 family protein